MENGFEVVCFTQDGMNLNVNVSPNEETVWLSLSEMCLLFGRGKSVISRHIKNVFKDDELDEKRVVAKKATTAKDGKTYDIVYYNLDVIISVGYRVNSKNGIVFRKWANGILRSYLLKSYVVNENRTLVTNENYINLIHKVESMDLRINNIEKRCQVDTEKLFFAGEYLDARVFLKSLFASAVSKITLVDPCTFIK